MFSNLGDNSGANVDHTSKKSPMEPNEDDDDDDDEPETTLTDYSQIPIIGRFMASPEEEPITSSSPIDDKTIVPSVQDEPSIKPQTDVQAADSTMPQPDVKAEASTIPQPDFQAAASINPEPEYIKYIKRFLVFLISQAGLTFLVFGYIAIGGAVFQGLEKRKVKSSSLTIACIRLQHVKRLRRLTKLGERNWTTAANKVFMNFQKELFDFTNNKVWKDGTDVVNPKDFEWTYSGALLYAVTVITTIGFGNLTPQTTGGRLATIVYAIIGIPLMLLCLNNFGSFFAEMLHLLWYRWLKARYPELQISLIETRIPVSLCFVIVTGYTILGAMLFTLWEGWSFVDSIYFCFISLSTIGFGDLVPGYGSKDSVLDDEFKRVSCVLYLMIGLSLVAMCFELLQKECVLQVKSIARCLGLISDVEDQAP